MANKHICIRVANAYFPARIGLASIFSTHLSRLLYYEYMTWRSSNICYLEDLCVTRLRHKHKFAPSPSEWKEMRLQTQFQTDGGYDEQLLFCWLQPLLKRKVRLLAAPHQNYVWQPVKINH